MKDEFNYIDDLYCIHDAIKEDLHKYAMELKNGAKLDKGRAEYGDLMTHFAKEVRKEIFAEEGMTEEEIEGFTGSRGGTQGQGRAIRTTPGMSGMWEGEYDASMSMNGGSMRGGSFRHGGSMRGGNGGSGRQGRNAMGQFTGNGGWSGHEDPVISISQLRKMADMTTDHDEREYLLRMIERFNQEEN